MEINQIRYFCTLVETSHLRRAAELLGLSPGALSKSIHLLQSECKIKLFNPSGRSLEITDDGRRFFRLAQRALAEFEHLNKAISNPEVATPRIRIASFELFTTYFMNSIIFADFLSEDFLVLERTPGLIEGSPAGITSLDGWPNDIPRKVKYHFELLETGLQTSRQGLCAIFCPEFIIPLHNQIVKPELRLEIFHLPIKMTPVKRQIFMVKRKSDPEGPVLKKLAKNIRKICFPRLPL